MLSRITIKVNKFKVLYYNQKIFICKSSLSADRQTTVYILKPVKILLYKIINLSREEKSLNLKKKNSSSVSRPFKENLQGIRLLVLLYQESFNVKIHLILLYLLTNTSFCLLLLFCLLSTFRIL